MANNDRSQTSPDPTQYIIVLQEFVRAAKDRITVVNWPVEESSDAGIRQVRETYLRELLVAATQIRYERILQATSGETVFSDGSYDSIYIEHFRQMVVGSEGQLMLARLTVPITFAILDDRHLAVEINVLDSTVPSSAVWTPNGAFILWNAPAEMISRFKDLVEQLLKTSQKIETWSGM